MHKYNTQSGLALIIFLTIFLLSATGILLYRLNNRTGVMLEKQAQTARALAQAKEALIGYAATYVETHPDSPLHKIQQGFLPCPDYNGNGIEEGNCGDAGHSVIGRFPWRTLGLPPLRDGSGECLWYAVSGTYKSNPKLSPPLLPLITNNTDGLFIVKNADNVIIAPDTPEERAIAVIFAPGKPVVVIDVVIDQDGNEVIQEKIQKRDTTGSICGEGAIATDYLDVFNGISNARGDKDITNDTNDDIFKKRDFSTQFWVTSTPKDTPTFIQAPLTKTGFNDTLMLITHKDFKPVYERMNYWVAKQVAQCLKEYGKQYTREILLKHATKIENYRTEYTTQIQNYLDAHGTQCEKQCSEVCLDCEVKCESKCNCQSTCKENCKLECELECETEKPECTSLCQSSCQDACQDACQLKCDKCQSDCELYKSVHQNECDLCQSDCTEPLTTIKKYPWASQLDSLPVNHDDDYPDKIMWFGRIPDILTKSKNSDNDMPPNWVTDWTTIKTKTTLNGKRCFKRDDNLNNYEWGWWKEWREEVFFAVDRHHKPSATTYIWVKNNPKETLCILSQTANIKSECPVGSGNRNLPSNQLTINSTRKQSLVVIVAGRKLASQERTLPGDKVIIDNYLEADNIPLSKNFISKWATDDFNDAVCGIDKIGSSGEISCVNPPE
jgi:hypothetical protein